MHQWASVAACASPAMNPHTAARVAAPPPVQLVVPSTAVDGRRQCWRHITEFASQPQSCAVAAAVFAAAAATQTPYPVCHRRRLAAQWCVPAHDECDIMPRADSARACTHCRRRTVAPSGVAAHTLGAPRQPQLQPPWQPSRRVCASRQVAMMPRARVAAHATTALAAGGARVTLRLCRAAGSRRVVCGS